MTEAFNNWWDGDIQPTDNPYRQDSAAYWAWEGWKAGAAAEREACARVCESRQTPGTGSVAILNGAADAIRARGNA